MALVGGRQEEMGWRGFILEPMKARLGIWVGNIVLGLIWTAWHLPLFLAPGTSQTYMPLAAVIAHGTVNAFIPLFPTLVMESGVAQTRWWIHQTLYGRVVFETEDGITLETVGGTRVSKGNPRTRMDSE